MVRRAWIAAALIAAIGPGCDKKQDAPAAPAAVDTDSTGVAECDEYLAKMKECYEKNPTARDPMQGRVAQLREVFKRTATLPGGKEQLRVQCSQQIPVLEQNPICRPIPT